MPKLAIFGLGEDQKKHKFVFFSLVFLENKERQTCTFQVKTQTKCPFQRENIIFWGKYFFNIPQIFVLTNTFYLQWHFKMLLLDVFCS